MTSVVLLLPVAQIEACIPSNFPLQIGYSTQVSSTSLAFFAAVVLQQLMRDETDNNDRTLRLLCSNEIVLLDELTTRER